MRFERAHDAGTHDSREFLVPVRRKVDRVGFEIPIVGTGERRKLRGGITQHPPVVTRRFTRELEALLMERDHVREPAHMPPEQVLRLVPAM